MIVDAIDCCMDLTFFFECESKLCPWKLTRDNLKQSHIHTQSICFSESFSYENENVY